MSPILIHNSRRVYRIASIPADGIGPEVISAGIEVLEKLAVVLGEFEFRFDHFGWGSEFYKKHGKYIPDGGLDELKKYQAILFGSVGAPDVPDHISLWGLRLASMDHSWLLRKICATSADTAFSLPASATVCQRTSYQDLTRYLITAEKLSSGRAGLGDRAGK